VKPASFHPAARHEFDSAVEFYESRRPGLGAEFRAAVEAIVSEIRRSPRRFLIAREGGAAMGHLKRFPYTLHFTEIDGEIRILAVAHQSRKPRYWRGRRPD